MLTNSIAWWPNVGVLVIAAVIDFYTRRIPNWLSLPFLLAGIVMQSVYGGWHGFSISFAGICTAILLFGLPCFLKLMGMGDLKLAVGVGAWIGASQLILAFVVAAMLAGVMAVGYALRHRSLSACLDNTSDLIVSLASGKFRAAGQGRLGNAKALAIPYAPAFAIGTLFSFFAR